MSELQQATEATHVEVCGFACARICVINHPGTEHLFSKLEFRLLTKEKIAAQDLNIFLTSVNDGSNRTLMMINAFAEILKCKFIIKNWTGLQFQISLDSQSYVKVFTWPNGNIDPSSNPESSQFKTLKKRFGF